MTSCRGSNVLPLPRTTATAQFSSVVSDSTQENNLLHQQRLWLGQCVSAKDLNWTVSSTPPYTSSRPNIHTRVAIFTTCGVEDEAAAASAPKLIETTQQYQHATRIRQQQTLKGRIFCFAVWFLIPQIFFSYPISLVLLH